MKNKNGFTLIELLAVIAVLAIILVIATSSVIGTIKSSRTNVFVETMEMGVKNAKSVLATKGKLDTGSLKESMDYKENQYNFTVENVTIGGKSYYKIILSPNENSSKFKNIDFSSLSDQEKNESMFGYDNEKKEIYAFISKENGKLVSASPNGNEVVDSGDGDTPSDNTGGGGSDDGDTPTTPKEVKKIGEDVGSCKAMEKKEIYNVNDQVSFCVDGGSKEEFFVIGVDHAKGTIDLVTKYALSANGFQSQTSPTAYVSYGDSRENAIKSYIAAIKKHISEVSKTSISVRLVEAQDVLSSAECVRGDNFSYIAPNGYTRKAYSITCNFDKKSWIYMDKDYILEGTTNAESGVWSGYKFTSLDLEKAVLKTEAYYHSNGYMRLVVTVPLDIVMKQ